MGAVANLAPEQFRAIHAAVPFVDALTTILDPDLPLTVIEWEEWGDPLHDPEVYAYMKSYTPVRERPRRGLSGDPGDDQPERHPGPLRRAGQVGGRAASRSREGSGQLLLKTEMVAGHGGVSGRYQSWREPPSSTPGSSARSPAAARDRTGRRACPRIPESLTGILGSTQGPARGAYRAEPTARRWW